MYKNLFIYIALAIAIEGCRGHIRVKRIAETSKIVEKKEAAASDSVATIHESPSKLVHDNVVGGFQKGHVLNTKRGATINRSANDEHLMEDAKRNVWLSHETKGKVAGQEIHDGSVNEGEGKMVHSKENVGVECSVKDSESNLRNSKVENVGSEQVVRLDSPSGKGDSNTGVSNVNFKGHHELTDSIKGTAGLRVPRKTSKFEGKGLGSGSLNVYTNPALISTGTENHPASHGNGEDDNIKKLIEDVKLEGHKKELKPDVDVFLYSNVPAFYKTPPVLLEVYNTKESLAAPSMDHFYPSYKWLQRRSPMQSALEIANMMVKVGLDELENDDYGEHVPFIFDSNFANKGSGHKLERSFGVEAGFCPVHAKKVSLNGEVGDLGGEGGSHFTGCVCSVGKNIKDASSKLEELNRVKRTYPEDHFDFKSVPLLKPF